MFHLAQRLRGGAQHSGHGTARARTLRSAEPRRSLRLAILIPFLRFSPEPGSVTGARRSARPAPGGMAAHGPRQPAAGLSRPTRCSWCRTRCWKRRNRPCRFGPIRCCRNCWGCCEGTASRAPFRPWGVRAGIDLLRPGHGRGMRVIRLAVEERDHPGFVPAPQFGDAAGAFGKALRPGAFHGAAPGGDLGG